MTIGIGNENIVYGSDGAMIPLRSAIITASYDGNGNLLTTTVVYQGITYIQTRTYSGTNKVLTISRWISQATPPTDGDVGLLDGTPFLLLDGTNFLLLSA